jgi:holo-[acyl-carrier protein] synthase
MGVRVGIDVVDMRRIEALVDRYSETELGALFTSSERRSAARAPRRHQHYAVCFAAKEAVGKALGVGLAGIDWCDIEARPERSSLRVALTGAAAARAAALDVDEWHASFAVAAPVVVVQVVAHVAGAGWAPTWAS